MTRDIGKEDARQGKPRQGVRQVLVVSTLGAAVALLIAWLFIF